MREPLSGWRGDEPGKPEVWWHPPLRLSVNPHASPVPWGGAWFGADGAGMVWLPFGGDAETVRDAQLAAEDAARAMVADMAAALGGSVTWAAEGGE